MKACAAYGEKLSAFHDGELVGAEGDEIAAHLEACGACRERLLAFAELDARLREAPPAPAVHEEEWTRLWVSIDAAIAAPEEEWIDEKVLRAGDAAASLVRRLIPMAAAACLVLATWAYAVAANHAHAAETARASLADVGLGMDVTPPPAFAAPAGDVR